MNLHYLKEKKIESLDLEFIQKDVKIEAVKITSKGTETESFGPIIIGFTLGIFLLIGSMVVTNPIVTAIVEEKVNRVYEVLLSSLSPSEIIAGKIIGTALTGLIQMTIWILSLIIIIFLSQNFFPVPARMALIDVPAWQIFVTLLVNLTVLCVLIKSAAKIYKTAILYTGKKPSFREIFKWLKYA